MNDNKNNGNFFTFTWKIENARLLLEKKGECIFSPYFTIKKFLNTTWFLQFFPRGKGEPNSSPTNAHCNLVWSPSSNSILDEMEIGFQIISAHKPFLLEDFPKTLVGTCMFSLHTNSYGYSIFPYLPSPEHFTLFREDDVYIVCCMWLSESQVNKNSLHMDKLYTDLLLSNRNPSFRTDIRDPNDKMFLFPSQCFARSVVQVEVRKFSWSAEDFTDGKILKQFLLVTTSQHSSNFMVVLSNEECQSGPIKVSIHAINKASRHPILAICKVSVSDSFEKVRHSIESEHYFSPTFPDIWTFEISCDCATMNRNLDLFTGCLSYIHCEITISTGDIISWIERESYDCPVNRVCRDSSNMSPSKLEILDLFTNKRFTDVTFQLRGKTIQAHKAILCARSPVFCAMFENDMREKETNIINIEDIDADTMDQMLKFMYFGSIKDMNYELALKLYKAADKYQVLNLREKCAQFILSNLTVNNICPALCLGDTHFDEKFKNSIFNFILEHWGQIIISEEWNELLKQNVRLVAETLQEVCLKLSKIT